MFRVYSSSSGQGVQIFQVLGRVLCKLTSVVLDLVSENENESKLVNEQKNFFLWYFS